MEKYSMPRSLHQRLKPHLDEYGIKSEFIRMSGAEIHWVHCGAGQPILLLHGFGSFLYTWRKIIRGFSEKFEVHAIDMPGFGLSGAPPGFSNGLTDQADFIADMIKAMQWGKVTIIGHSFGGAVCMEVCQRHPELLRAAVLVGSSVPGQMSIPDSVMKNILLFKYYNRSLITQGELEVIELLNSRKQPDNLAELLLSTSFKESKIIKCPASVVWGRCDRVIDPQKAGTITSFFESSQLSTIESCGHAPHEECPGKFQDLVMPFLEGQKRPHDCVGNWG